MAINIDPGDSRSYSFDMFKVDPSTTDSTNRWPGDFLNTVTWANTFWSTILSHGSYTYSNEDIGGGVQGATNALGSNIHTPGVAIRFCDHDSITTDTYYGIIDDGSTQPNEAYTLNKA